MLFFNSNNAQLRELEHIRTNLLHSRKPLALPSASGPSSSATSSSHIKGGKGKASSPSLKSFLVMARFIARMRIASRAWAAQETIRRKLAGAAEEQRRSKRSRQFKVVRVDAS